MNNPIQAFIELKEKRLEALIRGGFLKRKDVYTALCGFADTVKQGIRCLKDNNVPFGDISANKMLILAVASFIALC